MYSVNGLIPVLYLSNQIVMLDCLSPNFLKAIMIHQN